MAKKDNLSPKHKLYLKGRAKGNSKTKAGVDAGYALTTAKNASSHIELIIEKNAGKSVDELLEEILPTGIIFQAVLDGLTAERVIVVETGVTKNVADHPTRINAARLAGQFKHLLNEKEKHAATDPAVFSEMLAKHFGSREAK